MPEEEPLYVGVFDPASLRKDILTSSKEIISSLRRYEQFQAIRDEKLKFVVSLAKTFREISGLNRRLSQLMPKAKISPEMLKKAEPEKPAAPKVVKTVGKRAPEAQPVMEKSRLDELEDELASVEEKLKGLE